MKLTSLFSLVLLCWAFTAAAQRKVFIPADHPGISYMGRVENSNPKLPRFWAPGVYIKANFSGTSCDIILHDEVLYGNNHNYVEIVVDGEKTFKVKLTGKTDTIRVVKGLSNEYHQLLICKNTESAMGYLEFEGLLCEEVLPVKVRRRPIIEFIGNSITCGMGADPSDIPCGKGEWYDQHNAYLAYGPVAARTLEAEWILSSVSGIGLIHSCCNMTITMPQVFDKMYMHADSIPWDFRYQPRLVTVCLGQNDGIQDSVKFCSAYVSFLEQIHTRYPKAKILCLTSPMADEKLAPVQKSYLGGILAHFDGAERRRRYVYKYFFSRRYTAGCGDHPDLKEHQEIAKELVGAIKQQRLF